MADSETTGPSEPGAEVQTQEPSQAQPREVTGPVNSDQPVQGSNPEEEKTALEVKDPQEVTETPASDEPQAERRDKEEAESLTVDSVDTPKDVDVGTDVCLPENDSAESSTVTADPPPEILQQLPDPQETDPQNLVPEDDTSRSNDNVDTVPADIVAEMNTDLDTAPPDSISKTVTEIDTSIDIAPSSSAADTVVERNTDVDPAPVGSASGTVVQMDTNVDTVPLSSADDTVGERNTDVDPAPVGSASGTVLQMDTNVDAVSLSSATDTVGERNTDVDPAPVGSASGTIVQMDTNVDTVLLSCAADTMAERNTVDTAPVGSASGTVLQMDTNVDTVSLSSATDTVAEKNTVDTAPVGSASSTVVQMDTNIDAVPLSSATDSVTEMDTDIDTAPVGSTNNTVVEMEADIDTSRNDANTESKTETPSEDIVTQNTNPETQGVQEGNPETEVRAESLGDQSNRDMEQQENSVDTAETIDTACAMGTSVASKTVDQVPANSKDEQNDDSCAEDIDDAQTIPSVSESCSQETIENTVKQKTETSGNLEEDNKVDSEHDAATDSETVTKDNPETETVNEPESATTIDPETKNNSQIETTIDLEVPESETVINPPSESVISPEVETVVDPECKADVNVECGIPGEILEVKVSNESKRLQDESLNHESLNPESSVQVAGEIVESGPNISVSTPQTFESPEIQDVMEAKDMTSEAGSTKDTETHGISDQSLSRPDQDTIHTLAANESNQDSLPVKPSPLTPPSHDIPQDIEELKIDDGGPTAPSIADVGSPVQQDSSSCSAEDTQIQVESIAMQSSVEASADVTQNVEQPLEHESVAPESQMVQPAHEDQQESEVSTKTSVQNVDISEMASEESDAVVDNEAPTQNVVDQPIDIDSAANQSTDLVNENPEKDMEIDSTQILSQNVDDAEQGMDTDEREVGSIEFLDSSQQNKYDSSQGFSTQHLEGSESNMIDTNNSIPPGQIVADGKQDTENSQESYSEAGEIPQSSAILQPSDLAQPLSLTAHSDDIQQLSVLSDQLSEDLQTPSVQQHSDVLQADAQEPSDDLIATEQQPSENLQARQLSDNLQANIQHSDNQADPLQPSETLQIEHKQPPDNQAVVQQATDNLAATAQENLESIQANLQKASETPQEDVQPSNNLQPNLQQASDNLPSDVLSVDTLPANVQQSSDSLQEPGQSLGTSQEPQPSGESQQISSAPEPSVEPQQFTEDTQPFVIAPEPSIASSASAEMIDLEEIQEPKGPGNPPEEALELTKSNEPQQQLPSTTIQQDAVVDFSLPRETFQSNEAADTSGDSNGCLVIDEAESKSDKDDSITISDTEAAAPVDLAMPKVTPESNVQVSAAVAKTGQVTDLMRPERSLVSTASDPVSAVSTAVSTSVIMKTPTTTSTSSTTVTDLSTGKATGDNEGKESITVQVSTDLQSSMDKVKADAMKSSNKPQAARDVGWTDIEGVVVPYLSRGNTKYVSVKMVENKMLSKYPSIDLEDMKDAGPIYSYYVTPEEAKLLTDINAKCYKHAFGTDPFSVQDLIVSLEDFQKFYKNIRIHFENLKKEKSADALTKEALAREKAAQERRQAESQRSKARNKQVAGNWIQINNTVCPYIQRGDYKFVPVNVMRFAARLLLGKDLNPHKVLSTQAEINILNMLCKNGGVNFLFDINTTKLIQLETVLRIMHPDKILVRNLPKKHPFDAAVFKKELEKPHNGIANGTQTTSSQKTNQNSGTRTSSSQQHLSGGSHQTVKPPENTALLQLRQMVTSHTQQHSVAGSQAAVSSMPPRSSAPMMPAMQPVSSHQRAVQPPLLPHPTPRSIPGLPPLQPITIAPVDSHHMVGLPPAALRQKADAGSSSHTGEALIKPIRLFEKTVSCILRAGERYALVEALTRLYFPNCTLQEFGKALQTLQRHTLEELTPKEEQEFINFYDLPVRSLKCKTIFPILSFEAMYEHLKLMFKDKKPMPKLSPKVTSPAQMPNPAHQTPPTMASLQHAFASSHPRGTTPTPSEGSRSSTPSEGSGPSRRPASADSSGAPASKKARPNPAAPKKLGNVLAKLKERQEHQLNKN